MVSADTDLLRPQSPCLHLWWASDPRSHPQAGFRNIRWSVRGPWSLLGHSDQKFPPKHRPGSRGNACSSQGARQSLQFYSLFYLRHPFPFLSHSLDIFIHHSFRQYVSSTCLTRHGSGPQRDSREQNKVPFLRALAFWGKTSCNQIGELNGRGLLPKRLQGHSAIFC